MLVNLMWLPLPIALAWIPALLFAKVLVCFLVPHASTGGAPPPRVCAGENWWFHFARAGYFRDVSNHRF
ncbi:hypothetical protein [Mycobacterium sp.]|uniref:hypothetical protein n=1 Tax=Mycobacterium sp. TaxID=1785 RepID=UPI003D6A73C0